jgi:hypothetical protein
MMKACGRSPLGWDRFICRGLDPGALKINNRHMLPLHILSGDPVTR